ncbi:MAG: DoxX family membrane protein [Solirubrobacterales bacterium]|nr:DoxX family membrane protein [Solirubrobacterales bacterium]
MKALRYSLGAFFILVGALHFIKPQSFVAIMPDWIPMHDEAVAVSGVAEIVGGAALFSDRTARFGGWWLIALLIAVFPANINMALNPGQVEGHDVPQWLLWLRLPLQPLAIWLTWLATKPAKPSQRSSD